MFVGSVVIIVINGQDVGWVRSFWGSENPKIYTLSPKNYSRRFSNFLLQFACLLAVHELYWVGRSGG